MSTGGGSTPSSVDDQIACKFDFRKITPKSTNYIAMAIFIPNLVQSESNPYIEALLARPWESVQNYVTVRPGAHMFYWLYYADGTRIGAQCKPLIIWIQGGPGFAASGIGNFAEIGPLTMDMRPRNHTWVKGRNVLLLDHPVGTGFSYVTNNSLLAKTDNEIVTDLFKAIEEFSKKHKGFRKTPTYLFGQSYGGKISTILAYYLHTAIEEKRLKMNLKGIGIGSGWVDPREFVLIYPEVYYHVGLIDQNTYLDTITIARELVSNLDKKNYTGENLEYIYGLTTEYLTINFNNFHQPRPDNALELLKTKINTYVKPTLSHVVDQDLEWDFKSEDVHYSVEDNYMIPSTKFLEMLLNGTDLKVVVYNGNLDAITPVAGASNWVHKLNWNGSEEFKRVTRHRIRGTNNGFYKEAKQLSFWWVFGAGHWVPEDNPEAMEQILEFVISDNV